MAGLIILGTRPETIKLVPVIKQLVVSDVPIIVVSTEQHPSTVNCIFTDFGLSINYRLKRPESSDLNNQLAHYLKELASTLKDQKFDFVMTQGDTLSAYAGMLYAYLNKIDFLYLESGLRTKDLSNPFPEEGLRVMMSHIAQMNFVPSLVEKNNLLKENVPSSKIRVVGNTGIDYIHAALGDKKTVNNPNTILLTIHRRENWPYLEQFFTVIARYANEHEGVQLIYPMHFNPAIQKRAKESLSNIKNLTLTQPLSSQDFYRYLSTVDLVITDSGGVQEEASFLNKKILVIREKTERYFFNQVIKQLPIQSDQLVNTIDELLAKKNEPQKFNEVYGDGKASKRVTRWICKEYKI